MNLIQPIIEQPIGLLLGAGAMLVLHAVLYVRQEVRHSQAEDASWEHGRRQGYHQCYRELCAPLERRIEALTGQECEAEPLPRNMPEETPAPKTKGTISSARGVLAFQHTVNL